MNKKVALISRLFGIAFCIAAAYLSSKANVDAGEWFCIFGVYFIAKGDYYELKGD